MIATGMALHHTDAVVCLGAGMSECEWQVRQRMKTGLNHGGTEKTVHGAAFARKVRRAEGSTTAACPAETAPCLRASVVNPHGRGLPFKAPHGPAVIQSVSLPVAQFLVLALVYTLPLL